MGFVIVAVLGVGLTALAEALASPFAKIFVNVAGYLSHDASRDPSLFLLLSFNGIQCVRIGVLYRAQ